MDRLNNYIRFSKLVKGFLANKFRKKPAVSGGLCRLSV